MLRADLINMQRQMMAQAPMQPMYQPPVQEPIPVARPMSAEAQFLRERATRKTNRSAGAGEPRAPKGRMSFEEHLARQFEKDGVI
jgi:hypothetical protein